jgi:hypothetical protein
MKIEKDDWKYLGILILFVSCIVGYQQYTSKSWYDVLADLLWLREVLIVQGPIMNIG